VSDQPAHPAVVPDPPVLQRRTRLLRLSGKASAAWLVICFALTAVLIPMAFRLPHWVEFEIVLAVWWAIWLGVLTRLLFTGHRVTDDHQLGEPRNWFTSGQAKPKEVANRDRTEKGPWEAKKDADRAWWDGFFWGSLSSSGDVAAGCEPLAYVLLVILALVLLLGAIWFVFEVAIPVVLFLLYVLARGMLAQVINDRHHCRGRLGRALAWGTLWATVYTAPLAGAVWFVHHVYRSQAA
jgi:hypothetical protein